MVKSPALSALVVAITLLFTVPAGAADAIYGNWLAIVDGKLYLNYSHDIQKTWTAGRDAYIAAADKNWPGVLQ